MISLNRWAVWLHATVSSRNVSASKFRDARGDYEWWRFRLGNATRGPLSSLQERYDMRTGIGDYHRR